MGCRFSLSWILKRKLFPHLRAVMLNPLPVFMSGVVVDGQSTLYRITPGPLGPPLGCGIANALAHPGFPPQERVATTPLSNLPDWLFQVVPGPAGEAGPGAATDRWPTSTGAHAAEGVLVSGMLLFQIWCTPLITIPGSAPRSGCRHRRSGQLTGVDSPISYSQERVSTSAIRPINGGRFPDQLFPGSTSTHPPLADVQNGLSRMSGRLQATHLPRHSA